MTGISPELMQRIKLLEIKTRRVVDGFMGGDYHSAFKGQGLHFSEVRPYQFGDDIRFIDWNVTAKTSTPHIKVFEEERELTVMLVVDASASESFAGLGKSKREIQAEVASLLGFSAMHNRDQVGMLLFSDQIESFIPPKKGKTHMLRLVRDIFHLKSRSPKTSIAHACEAVMNYCRKRSVVILISDFQDEGYDDALAALSLRHDVVPIIIEDPNERSLPNIGLMLVEDPETGDQVWVDSSSEEVQSRFNNIVLSRQFATDRVFKRLGLTPIRIQTNMSYIEPIHRYFKKRGRV